MSAPTYIAWRQGAERRYEVSAEAAHQEITAIAERNGGMVTAEDLVECSRSGNAVLHSCFDWNDTEAAEKYRRQQARNLIGSIEVRYEPAPEVTTRGFEIVRVEANRGYRETSVIMGNRDEREQLLQRAQRELQSFRKRHASLVELQEVFASIDEFTTRQGVAGQ